MSTYDVIVVGAGFAGATAARECAIRGLKTLVIEAKDRIGGRSGSRTLKDGSAADVGGTFVNWTQPHVWAEITRYGLTDQIIPGGVGPEWSGLYTNGVTTWESNAAAAELERRAFEKIIGKSAEVFPNPAEPMQNLELVTAMDALSVAEGLQEFDLEDDERSFLEETLGNYAGRPAAEASWSNTLRWFAMGGDNYDDLMSMLMKWKFKCGTGGLISRILDDGGAELRLNTVVSAINSRADGVTVTLDDGGTVEAKTVVIAVPANVWSTLDLTPALNPLQREASEEGMQVPWAAKAVAVIKGEPRSVIFTGDETVPISFFTQGFREDDVQALACYPMDPSLELTEEGLREAIETAMPHVTVLTAVGDKYLPEDPAFHGAWSFLLPGQLTKYVPHENFTRLDERVVFATSDISKYFHSFIDGAIESGLRAAHDVRGYLATEITEAALTDASV